MFKVNDCKSAIRKIEVSASHEWCWWDKETKMWAITRRELCREWRVSVRKSSTQREEETRRENYILFRSKVHLLCILWEIIILDLEFDLSSFWLHRREYKQIARCTHIAEKTKAREAETEAEETEAEETEARAAETEAEETEAEETEARAAETEAEEAEARVVETEAREAEARAAEIEAEETEARETEAKAAEIEAEETEAEETEARETKAEETEARAEETEARAAETEAEETKAEAEAEKTKTEDT